MLCVSVFFSQLDLANWEYVVNGTARDERDIPLHVKQSFISGSYHGGKLEDEDYDAGKRVLLMCCQCVANVLLT